MIQAAKVAGARDIVGVDINEGKFETAKKLGATACVNSLTCPEGDVKAWLLAREKWGYDFTFDCTGNVNVMRTALEVAHRGWGESCIIGVAAAGKEICTRERYSQAGLSLVQSLCITAFSLVESFIVMLRQLSYAIKNQLKAPKARY